MQVSHLYSSFNDSTMHSLRFLNRWSSSIMFVRQFSYGSRFVLLSFSD